SSIAGYLILPALPPFPTASNLPFHPHAGIQTSTLMSESAVGFTVAASRQNAGNTENRDAFCAALPPPGALKPPAGTSSASVTVAFCSVANFSRLSQELLAAFT